MVCLSRFRRRRVPQKRTPPSYRLRLGLEGMADRRVVYGEGQDGGRFPLEGLVMEEELLWGEVVAGLVGVNVLQLVFEMVAFGE